MTEHEKIPEMICQKEQLPIALEPRQTALVIVDVQRFFTRPDSELPKFFKSCLQEPWMDTSSASVPRFYRRFKNCRTVSARSASL